MRLGSQESKGTVAKRTVPSRSYSVSVVSAAPPASAAVTPHLRFRLIDREFATVQLGSTELRDRLCGISYADGEALYLR